MVGKFARHLPVLSAVGIVASAGVAGPTSIIVCAYGVRSRVDRGHHWATMRQTNRHTRLLRVAGNRRGTTRRVSGIQSVS